MKKIRTIGKAALSLLLCCAMLSCAAFAAGPVEVYHLGDLTITFGGEPLAIEPRDYLWHKSVPCYGSHYTEAFSRATDPNDGDNLSVRVDSIGGIEIEVKCTIRYSNGGKFEKTDVISPSGYFYVDITGNGNGVNCDVTIQVKAYNANETGTANVSVKQW